MRLNRNSRTVRGSRVAITLFARAAAISWRHRQRRRRRARNRPSSRYNTAYGVWSSDTTISCSCSRFRPRPCAAWSPPEYAQLTNKKRKSNGSVARAPSCPDVPPANMLFHRKILTAAGARRFLLPSRHRRELTSLRKFSASVPCRACQIRKNCNTWGPARPCSATRRRFIRTVVIAVSDSPRHRLANNVE